MAAGQTTLKAVVSVKDKAAGALNRIGGRTAALRGQFKNLGTILTTGILAIGFKKVIDAAMVQEVALRKLQTAVEGAGESWGKYSKELTDATTAMQLLTRFGDEEMQPALAMLIDMSGNVEASLAALPAVLGLVEKGFFSLEGASRNVGMAMTGNFTMLGRAVSEFKGEAAKTMTTQEAMIILNRKFGDAAFKMGQTNAAAMKRIANDFGDLKEEIGAGALAISKMLNIGARPFDLIRNGADIVVGSIMTVIHWVTALIKIYGVAFNPFNWFNKAAWDSLVDTITGIGKLAAKVLNPKNWITAAGRASIKEVFTGIKEDIAGIFQPMRDLGTAIVGELKDAAKKTEETWDVTYGNIEARGKQSKDVQIQTEAERLEAFKALNKEAGDEHLQDLTDRIFQEVGIVVKGEEEKAKARADAAAANLKMAQKVTKASAAMEMIASKATISAMTGTWTDFYVVVTNMAFDAIKKKMEAERLAALWSLNFVKAGSITAGLVGLSILRAGVTTAIRQKAGVAAAQTGAVPTPVTTGDDGVSPARTASRGAVATRGGGGFGQQVINIYVTIQTIDPEGINEERITELADLLGRKIKETESIGGF